MALGVYLYVCAFNDGTGPHLIAGNTDADSAMRPSTFQPTVLGRETSLIAAQAHALTASLLKPVSIAQRQNMGLFLGTRFGSLEDDRMFQESRLADGGKFASPAAFRRTLPSTVPAELSIAFGIRGPLITYVDANAPAMLAIIRAVSWIASGHISTAIAGSYDYYSSGLPDRSGRPDVCRTLLCLISTRAAILEITPWAEISEAGITSNAPNEHASRNSDFPALLQVMTMTTHGRQTIQCASMTGVGYYLTLDI